MIMLVESFTHLKQFIFRIKVHETVQKCAFPGHAALFAVCGLAYLFYTVRRTECTLEK